VKLEDEKIESSMIAGSDIIAEGGSRALGKKIFARESTALGCRVSFVVEGDARMGRHFVVMDSAREEAGNRADGGRDKVIVFGVPTATANSKRVAAIRKNVDFIRVKEERRGNKTVV
jgi:hypothetical protein